MFDHRFNWWVHRCTNYISMVMVVNTWHLSNGGIFYMHFSLVVCFMLLLLKNWLLQCNISYKLQCLPLKVILSAFIWFHLCKWLATTTCNSHRRTFGSGKKMRENHIYSDCIKVCLLIWSCCFCCFFFQGNVDHMISHANFCFFYWFHIRCSRLVFQNFSSFPRKNRIIEHFNDLSSFTAETFFPRKILHWIEEETHTLNV